MPADVATAVAAIDLPNKFWDGLDPIIDFYLERCGQKKLNIMKHKMKKLGDMIEKACRNQPCKSFFQQASSIAGRKAVTLNFPRKYHRFMKKLQ